MSNDNRTKRIALRCTPDELDNMDSLASMYNLSTADLIRQAVIIAATKAPDQAKWRRAYTNALENPNEIFIWLHPYKEAKRS